MNTPILTGASLAAAQWSGAIDTLNVEIARLLDAAVRGDRTVTRSAASTVSTTYKAAVDAARVYGATGAKVPPELQAKWNAALLAMDNAVKSAALVIGPAKPLPPVVTTASTSGLRIPGTSIIVPWVALLGVGAVIAAGLYFKKRRK